MHNRTIDTERHWLDEIESFSRCPIQFRILELLGDSARSRADLQQTLGVHRTTVRKHLERLEKANRVEEVPAENTYRISPTGRIVVRSVRRTITDFRTANRLGDALSRLPESPPANAPTLRTCDVTPCDSNDPYAPVERFVALVGVTETFRGFVPVCNPMYVEPFDARIAAGHDFEIVGTPHVFESIRSKHPDTFETALEVASTRLLVVENLPQFGVALFDDTAVIAAYDEDMRTHSLLEACDEQQELVEWIEQQYETQRQAAIPYEEYAEN